MWILEVNANMFAKLVYVTGNDIKFSIAKKVFKNTGIELVQRNIDTPEIQSKSVEDIATFSAIWASKEINETVAVTDAGFYIEALNGFPGPFIKYVNEWFSVDDYLNLMRGKTNRTIIVRDCLAYCKPNEKPITFIGLYKGNIAYEAGRKGTTPIEQLFIPQGYNAPISEMSSDDALTYWSNGDIWRELKEYLIDL